MDITYLGHSSFLIKTKSVSIVADPYGDDIGLKFPKVEAEIVTVSHQHGDHNKTGCVSGVKKVFDAPGEYEVSEVSFIAIPTYHDDKKGEERGTNLIFVIEAEGFRLVHLGDLGHKLKDSKVDAIGEVDIIMVPVGGVYTIGPKEASDVVKSLEPKIILPMHYKIDQLNQSTFGEMAPIEEFLGEYDGKVEYEKKLKLTSINNLPEDEVSVVVLERK